MRKRYSAMPAQPTAWAILGGMPDDNAARVQRAFDAFARGDLETAFEFIDPSFEVHDRVVLEASPTTTGPAALVENVGMVTEAFGEVVWDPREIIDRGDLVVVRVHMSAKGHHTALPVEEDVGHVYTIEERQGRAARHLPDWKEALEAAEPAAIARTGSPSRA